MSDTKTKILVTGRLWLGADGGTSIGSEIISILEEARQEVIIVAYRLTVAVPELRQAIENLLDRGCFLRVVRDMSGDLHPSEEAYFSQLQARHNSLSIFDFTELGGATNAALHAKMIVVDRTTAVVGSANFSRNGMIENHEIAISIRGPQAKALGRVCDKLVENGVREGILVRRLP